MRRIDADALMKRLKEDPLYPLVKRCNIEGFINAEPTVDAVPVVRCKDCKHRDPEDRKCDCGHDIMWQLPRDDDWYCADGERKDGGDEKAD